jgi:hypothetical protein
MQAFFTHNIPRYSLPAHPLMLLALSIAVADSMQYLRARFSRVFRSVQSPSDAETEARPAMLSDYRSPRF